MLKHFYAVVAFVYILLSKFVWSSLVSCLLFYLAEFKCNKFKTVLVVV